MTFAPVVAIALGVSCGIPLLFTNVNSLLTATLSLGLLAWATRALHLDGLADTADGLGSGKPAAQALEIARKSDIGPFAVIALIFTLLLQVFALSTSISHGTGYLAFIVAVAGSRVALVLACTRGVPAARPDGLGALVANTVPRTITIIWTLAVLAGAYFLLGLGGLLAVGVGLASALLLLNIATRRLGGVSGDVLGAVIEITTTTTLVVAAFS